MRLLLGLLACLLLAACSSSSPSSGAIRAEFTQNLPGLLELKDFKLEDGHNVGSDDKPVWVARYTATVAPRQPTFDIDTVEGDVRILKPVRAAGEAMSLYGSVRSTRSGDTWSHRFQSDGSSNPVIGRPRSDYGPDALVAGSPEAKALLAKIAQQKEQARIAEETRLATEAAERKTKEEAEAAKRKRVEAAVAKYHAGFAPDKLGGLVSRGEKGRFLVTGAAEEGRVWGTDIYTCGSTFSKTVVHAGLLKDGETGIVEVKKTNESHRNFAGSPRNGVASMNDEFEYEYCTVRLLERISTR